MSRQRLRVCVGPAEAIRGVATAAGFFHEPVETGFPVGSRTGAADLALDEMNEADKTAGRIAAWTAQVKAEAGV